MQEPRIFVFEKKFYIHPIYKTIRGIERWRDNKHLWDSKAKKLYLIHRFLWESIKRPIQNDKVINHINEIKTENRL